MLFFVSFSKLIQLIRSLTFIGMWLILAVIVSNLGPPVAKMGIDIDSYRCWIGTFVGNHGGGVMTMCMPFFFDFSVVIKFIGTVSFVRLLLIMAGIEQNPGPVDRKYIFRYQYLLVEIGTDIMRKVFDFKVGSDFVKHLSADNNKFYNQLQSLISAKIITADQAQYLPPIDMSPQTTKFDITLLACLLRNVCGLRNQKDPVWKNPPPTDFSLEADLARLKECRNKLQHSGTVFISEADLADKWNDLSQILIRLNTVCGIPNLSSLINDAEGMNIDEELKQKHEQAVKAWADLDILCDRGIEDLKLRQSVMEKSQENVKGCQNKQAEHQKELEERQNKIAEHQKELADRQNEQADRIQAVSNTLHECNPTNMDTKSGTQWSYVDNSMKL